MTGSSFLTDTPAFLRSETPFFGSESAALSFGFGAAALLLGLALSSGCGLPCFFVFEASAVNG